MSTAGTTTPSRSRSAGPTSCRASTPARRPPTPGRTAPRRRCPEPAPTGPATSARRSPSRCATTATKPVVTAASRRAPPTSNGWYNRAVSVAFAGSDPTAGIESCTSATYAGPDSGAASLAGTCTRPRRQRQRARSATGSSTTRPRPQVTARGSGSRGERRWLVQPLGRLRDPAAPTRPRASRRVRRSTLQRAGLRDRERSRARAATGPATPPAARSRSSTTPRAPTVTRGDGGARCGRRRLVQPPGRGRLQRHGPGSRGVDTCSTVSYSGPDSAAASVPGTCTDQAGNVSAPLASGSSTTRSAPDGDRWHAGARGGRERLVQPRRRDRLRRDRPVSGVDSCTSSTYAGAGQRGGVGRRHLHRQGRQREQPARLRAQVRLDRPAGDRRDAATEPRRGTAGTTARSRSTSTASDATSGVADCPSVTYTGPDGDAAPVIGRCTDRAGNSAAGPSRVKYDDTAPEVAESDAGPSAQRRRVVQPPGRADLRRRRRDVGDRRLHDEDATQGPDSAAASVPGTCTDKAGNVSGDARARAPLRRDRTGGDGRRAGPRRRTRTAGTTARSPSCSAARTRRRASDALHDRHLPRAGHRGGIGLRHLRRPCRQHQRPARARPQVRRDGTGRDRRAARAAARPCRLVRDARALRRHRHGRDVGRRQAVRR